VLVRLRRKQASAAGASKRSCTEQDRHEMDLDFIKQFRL
jgi:hypothetical protein